MSMKLCCTSNPYRESWYNHPLLPPTISVGYILLLCIFQEDLIKKRKHSTNIVIVNINNKILMVIHIKSSHMTVVQKLPEYLLTINVFERKSITVLVNCLTPTHKDVEHILRVLTCLYWYRSCPVHLLMHWSLLVKPQWTHIRCLYKTEYFLRDKCRSLFQLLPHRREETCIGKTITLFFIKFW